MPTTPKIEHHPLQPFLQKRIEVVAAVIFDELLRTIDYDYPNFHLTMHCFKCRLKEQSPMTNEQSSYTLLEHEAAKWLAPNELQSVQWLPADEDLITLLTRVNDYKDILA